MVVAFWIGEELMVAWVVMETQPWNGKHVDCVEVTTHVVKEYNQPHQRGVC